MLESRFVEFVVEFARALLIDELSAHVRNGTARFLSSRRRKDYRRVLREIERRNRKRLMHKLRTEVDRDL